MILYHTSYMVVEQPDLEHSRDYLDFGKGFYLTSLRHQAVMYSERFFLRGRQAFLGEYDLSEAHLDLSIKRFDAYDEECSILSFSVVKERISQSMTLLLAVLLTTRFSRPSISTLRVTSQRMRLLSDSNMKSLIISIALEPKEQSTCSHSNPQRRS